MTRRISMLTVAFAGLLATTTLWAQEAGPKKDNANEEPPKESTGELSPEVEELADKLEERWSKVRSLKADVISSVRIDVGAWFDGAEVTETGKVMALRKDGTFYFREEMTRGEGDTALRKLSVFDGDFHWMQQNLLGKPDVIKSPGFSGDTLGGRTPLGGSYTSIEILPDDKISGFDTYVVKAFYNEYFRKRLGAYAKMWFSKDTGMVIQETDFKEKGEKRSSTTYKNIRINVDVDPAKFNYEPPEGAEVHDVTDGELSDECKELLERRRNRK